MQKQKIFITRRIPEAGISLLEQKYEVDIWQEDLPPAPAELRKRAQNCCAILSMLSDKIDVEVMEAIGKNLKVISNYAVGFDNIEVAEATRRGIAVGNTPDVLTNATADFAFALLMAAARRVVEADASVRAGSWKTWGPAILLGADLTGATLGIIGFGRIGQAVARRALGFEMRILYYDPSIGERNLKFQGEQVTLERLLRDSDFITLHAPLNPQTRRMINTDTLELVKPGAILINTARGGLIDQQVLYEALKSRKLAYAALDVTDPEPLPKDSPLLTLDNLVITPHIASASRTTRERMAVMAAQNILAGLNGQRLPWCVNPEVYG